MSKVIIYDNAQRDVKNIIEDIFRKFPLDVSGKKILVKPNMLGPFEQEKGVTTNPVVIETVVDYLLAKGADVIVGDNPGGQGGGVDLTAKKCGIYQASKGTYRNIGDSCVMYKTDSRFFKEITISRVIHEVDMVINLPRFKTHGYAGLSGAIKNMFGYVVGPGKANLHLKTPRIEDFCELLVDLYQIRVPELTIVDGIYAMEGMGPTTGKLRWLDKIIAGTDGVAVDTVISRMMGFKKEDIKYIHIAAERGLGTDVDSEIEVVGDDSKIENFELPVSYSKTFKASAPGIEGVMSLYKVGHMVPKFEKVELCKRCRKCMEACPAAALTFKDNYPVIDHRKCISCFCCAEMCAEGCFAYIDAVDIFENMFSKLNKTVEGQV